MPCAPRFFAPLFLLAAILLTVPQAVSAQSVSAQSSAAASSRGTAGDIADLDHLLSRAKSGQEIVWVGDMGLKVASLQRCRQELADRQTGHLRPNSAFDAAFSKWPGGNVPYAFDPGVPDADHSILLKACQDWMAVANVNFYPRTTETNYVVFTNSATGNNSLVGMIGGAQAINIQDYQEFLICHEVGHALGLIHEQSRSDRDAYITINTANIQAGQQGNFDMVPGSLNHRPYDFDSIMQYFLTAFSSNGQPTMTVNPPYDSQWNSGNVGTESHLSAADKAGMADIYGSIPASPPATRYVSPSGSDSGSGSQAAPFLTIQAGINASTNGDTLIVTDGTYTGPGNVDLTLGGRDMTVMSQNGPAKTIIDCGASSSANHRGMVIQNGEVNAVISGFTLENGYESVANGAGMLISNSSVSVQNCVFKNNTASSGNGGGLYNDNRRGAVTLVNCTITSNAASSGYGGGVYNNSSGGTVAITHCTVTANAAADGGAVYTYTGGGTVGLTNCSVTGNMASGNGGGLYNNASSGAITVTGCSIAANTAAYGGGIISFNSSGAAITLTSCSITGNIVTSGGGGLYSSDGVTLANCAITSNTAGFGGGVFNSSAAGPNLLTNCTIAGNTAGGGVYNYSGINMLTNDIVYGDTGGEISNASGVVPTISFSDIQGGYAGTGNLDADPLFVNAPADVHLKFSSPCLSAGTASGAPVIDKDGRARPNPPSIGAYELQPSHTHLLWTNTNVAASLWTLNPDGTHIVSQTYGPYATWTAKGISDGPDGTTHILWTNTSGAAAVWNVAANGTFTQHSYGPFAGYHAANLSTGSDGSSHLMWTKTDGTASLWNLNTTTGAYTYATYGPFANWTARAVASGAATTDLLWVNTSGQASGWKIAANGTHQNFEYGPYTNWAAASLSVGPDEGAHLLWDNTSGSIALWSVNFGTGSFTQSGFGPFSGWTAKAAATGPDGMTHLLWGSTNGTASVWAMNSGGYTHAEYGPYSGWTAVALSAGP